MWRIGEELNLCCIQVDIINFKKNVLMQYHLCICIHRKIYFPSAQSLLVAETSQETLE